VCSGPKSWTTDSQGNVIGDFAGEALCQPPWPCAYWNPNSHVWGEYEVYPTAAQQVIGDNAQLWQQATCVFESSAADTLGSLGEGAGDDTLKGGSDGYYNDESIINGAFSSLKEGTATTFMGIYSYAKYMYMAGYKMVAGCSD